MGWRGEAPSSAFLVRSDEVDAAILIAARMDNTTFLECLEYEVHDDHEYKETGKVKQAR